MVLVAATGEKTPSFAPHPKHRSVASSSYGAAVPLCMGGAEVRRFSRSTLEDLLHKPEYPGLSSHRGSSFLFTDSLLEKTTKGTPMY